MLVLALCSFAYAEDNDDFDLTAAMQGVSEDPEVWYDAERERYYSLYHAFGYIGMITPLNGLDWKRATHYKVSDKSYTTIDGETVEVHRYERPTIFHENGKQRVMAAGIRTFDGDTFTMFIPLKQ